MGILRVYLKLESDRQKVILGHIIVSKQFLPKIEKSNCKEIQYSHIETKFELCTKVELSLHFIHLNF